MRALRSTWGARVLAALLAVSLLSLILLPVGQKASPKGAASYATWLRAQVTGEPDAVFDQALAAAKASRAHGLRGFLAAFVDAYVEQAPPEQLAEVFAAGDRSGGELIRYLERHYLRLAGTQGMVLGSLTAAAPPLLKLHRWAGTLPGAGLLQRPERAGGAQPVLGSDTPLFVFSLRTLFSAQPLGP